MSDPNRTDYSEATASTSIAASQDEPTISPAAPKRAALWEDFIDILYAPTEVYERRATSGFGLPLLIVAIVIGLISLANSSVLQPLMDAEFTRVATRQMAKNPQLTMEMMEKGRSIGETFAKIGGFIIVPIAVFFTGLFLWMVGKFVDAKQSLSAAIMVATYAYVPRIIESVIFGVQGLLMDPASMTGRYKLSLGAGRFLDPDTSSPILLAILGRIDLFTIWVTVLLAIGLAVTGRISRQRAAIAAAIVWVVGGLFGLLGAMRG